MLSDYAGRPRSAWTIYGRQKQSGEDPRTVYDMADADPVAALDARVDELQQHAGPRAPPQAAVRQAADCYIPDGEWLTARAYTQLVAILLPMFFCLLCDMLLIIVQCWDPATAPTSEQ
ncbi:hypothetical protein DAEQUDRAFT_730330 [Daedalea quercina L-15889]|uniref:Uncharacterized protein n=1 Tax=Daedalea quercina L-15889 TaxID=1314783 RepID=A0A165N0L7_9APHY|nr:hypothetical protein DAEQUDRAFT_730330 [Daedalea quercina L-15889]